MRKLFITVFMVGLELFCAAQTNNNLSPKMEAFKQYCENVSKAAANCDVDVLADCISQWEPAQYDATGAVITGEKFVYANEEINYTPFGSLQKNDADQEATLDGHFKFLPADVDTLIANNCEPVAIAEAHQLRAGENHCEYLVSALQAKGKASYSTRGSGRIEMFVMPENGGKVNLSIHSIERNYKKEVTGETTLSDAAPEGKDAAQLVWEMSRNGEIEFTIENTTDAEISFIVVKNL